MDPIVERIKEIQETSGMTNVEFAMTLDISPASLSHIYNGRNKPSLSVIESILKNLDVSADYLLLGKKHTVKPLPEQAPPTPSSPSPAPRVSEEETLKSRSAKKIQSVITTYEDGTFDIFLPNHN
jgi:transcriptional regulator with XRE-family HTH domain